MSKRTLDLFCDIGPVSRMRYPNYYLEDSYGSLLMMMNFALATRLQNCDCFGDKICGIAALLLLLQQK